MKNNVENKNFVPHTMTGGAIIGGIIGDPIGAFVGGLLGDLVGLGMSEDMGGDII
ncbi:MAG: hypothetical protein ACYDAP_02060 [Thermoplasmataceae archaeon]